MSVPSVGDVTAAELDEATERIDEVRAELPFPDDVVECLKVRAASEPELLDALGSSGDVAKDPAVLTAGAACTTAVAGASVFAQGLQANAGGSLSDEQLDCAAQAYAGVSAEDLQALTGAVMNPDAGDEGATEVFEQISSLCEIELKGGD